MTLNPMHIATLPASRLKTQTASRAADGDRIVKALDILFTAT